MTSLVSTWPLVGRDAELTQIAKARESGCCGVVISASSGAGKSRLGREALAAAGREGALTEWVQATRSAALIPLGAFAGLLPDAVRSDESLELLRGSVQVLRDRARGRPIVLAVDDAQLLDPVSATLALHVATAGGTFVIATVRSGEPCPDAIVSLWKDGGAHRLELGRLSDEAVRSLVETALGGPVEEHALRWVVERSQGHPLYARELVLGAVDAGRLAFAGDLWRLSGRPSVSSTLVELVEERLAALTPEQRAPVELLAVSEPLRLPEIATLTSYDALADAEAHGLIAIDSSAPEPEIRLAHPLYGDALRAQLPALRSRALRLRLATTLQQREPLAADDALRVVRLLLDAGAAIPPALLVGAARAANLAGDPDLGAQLAERAVADGGAVAAALVLARANSMRRHFEEAEAALATIEAEMAGHESAVDYLEQRVRVLFWGLGQVDEARALLDRARSWSSDPLWERRLLPLRMPITSAEDLAGALAAVEAVLADPALDPHTRRLLETRYAMLLFYAGRWNESYAVSRRHRPAVPIRDYSGLMSLPAYRIAAVESGLDWPELETSLGQTLRDGVRCNDHEAAAQAAVGLAHLQFLRGRFRDAKRWLAEAEGHFEREDAFGLIADVRMLEVGIAYVSGDPSGTVRPLEQLRALSTDARPRPLARAAYLERAEGWAACARSSATGVAKLLSGAETFARDMPGFASMLAYDALLAGAPPARVSAFLPPLAARCRTRMVDAYADHAAALAARDGEALLRAADTFAAIGALRYAMNAAAHAATVFVTAGRQDSARNAAARARDHHTPGQGTEPPAIDGLDGIATALTARESQLVGLAKRGMSNAEIADQLVLSVRTVEAHLYRAMQKLGVRDRRDL